MVTGITENTVITAAVATAAAIYTRPWCEAAYETTKPSRTAAAAALMVNVVDINEVLTDSTRRLLV